MGALCLVIGDIGIETIINHGVIGDTGNDMRIQHGVIREARHEGHRLKKLVKGDEGLDICIHVNTAIFQKHTESPEIGLDGGIGNRIKDVRVHRRII